MRATKAAGREVFGYNRSIDAVQAAKFEGFDATENLDEALARAADSNALIVLAVPVPALPLMLGRIRESAPHCPLTDVTSVKSAVLQEVKSVGLLERFVGGHPMAGTAHSGWSAGDARLFVGAPWVISVDDHVAADVWTMVMNLALDCGSVVVPARSDEHDAAAAPDLVRAMCEANADELLPALERTLESLGRARDALRAKRPLSELVEAGHAARIRYDSFSRPEIVTVVVGAENWRDELAAAGRAGGVIRSALPILGNRG